jgi:hypothetical protein
MVKFIECAGIKLLKIEVFLVGPSREGASYIHPSSSSFSPFQMPPMTLVEGHAAGATLGLAHNCV